MLCYAPFSPGLLGCDRLCWAPLSYAKDLYASQ